MGGHLDNKNSPLVEDPSVWSNPSHLVLARTAEDDGLDLIAEETETSVASTTYPDQEPRYLSSIFFFPGYFLKEIT